MLATISREAVRSAAFISTLLLTTAFTAPAFAQIETVVVTAEKKAEDIQTVPIAVSAFDGKDLQSHQITQFKDLQFSIPNVTFTKGNFGPSNFQIRGIGSAAVATSGDSGVAVNVDDIYLNAPPLTGGTYFDVDRVEVLRGPQSTLYGRNATGGAINIVTSKPDLDKYGASAELTYGNFNDREVRAEVNIPLIDGKLGLRVAGFGEQRDGDITNIYGNGLPGSMDSRDDYSIRTAIRYEPTENTTIDLMWTHGAEFDSRQRAVVQACHRDPSGVLGCLPDKLAFDPINLNSTLAYTFPSDIGPLAGTAFQLTQLGGAAGAPGAGASWYVPSDYRTVNTDFQPTTRGHDDFEKFTIHQKLGSWLNLDVLLGHDQGSTVTEQGYSNTIGESFSAAIPANAVTPLQAGTLAFLHGVNPVGCPTATAPNRLTADQYLLHCLKPVSAAAFYDGHAGTLPISGIGNYGLSGGNIRDYADHFQAYDEGDGTNAELNQEVRFTTAFDGPVNFLFAGYHITTKAVTDYYVNSTALDFVGVVVPALLVHDGYVYGPSQYDNHTFPYKLNSDAVFGEVYYDITDNLKFTGGLRYSEDRKTVQSQQTLFNCFWPAGTSAGTITAILGSSALCPKTALTAAPPLVEQATVFHSLTGRAVLDWKPQLSFTDATLVYASYSRGNRPGGFNPPSSTGAFAPTFASENVDALELGTKNTLLDGLLQANLTAWYYNYQGYQISKIVDRTAINANVNAKLWGIEGEFFWSPYDNLQFNASFGYTNSDITSGQNFDTRNPSQNDPNTTVVKDYNAANCVITNSLGTGPVTPATDAFFGTILVDPPVTSLPGTAARVAFLQGSAGLSCGNLDGVLLAHYGVNSPYRAATGINVNLKGNSMPDTPPFTFNIGVQYTFDVGGGYTLVPRADYYWKDQMWASMFNAPTDLVKSWDETAAQVQLNAPDDQWYVRGWVKNLMDRKNVTGSYVTDPSSGLFTNLFVEEPRTYGISLGAHF